ncbi:MAG: efflux RND transporter periplasmic adaptor subunit [Planctomycetia bacterium]
MATCEYQAGHRSAECRVHSWVVLTLTVCILAAAGCEHEAAGPAAAAAVEESPYRVTAAGLLEVRQDLVPRLKFIRAETSPVFAELHGVGEIDFAPGSLTALRVPFEGIIESVEVSPGAKVSLNAVLARVRSSELAKMRADIRRLSSELTGQYDAMRRARELVESEAISNRRLIELQAKIGSLEAERNGILFSIRAARATEEGEDLFELLSPRDGEIIQRHVEPGEHAHDPENQPAFIVADPTALIVRAQFPERDAPLLKEGFHCRVEVRALGDIPLPGRVVSVVRSIDPERRTVGVTCVIEALPAGVRAHMLAHVCVAVEGDPVIVVPRDAVLLRRDARVAFVRHGEGTLERRPVMVGPAIDNRVVVLSGVNEGEEVVVEGAVLLDGELDRLL